MKRLHKSEKGFTLVELMVVVVIIGILVAIAIPVYQGIQANARNSACSANIRTLSGAVAQYYTEVGVYPADIEWLWSGAVVKDEDTARTVPRLAGTDDFSDPTLEVLRFVEEEPFCPWNPNDVSYGYAHTVNSYNIDCPNDDCGNYSSP